MSRRTIKTPSSDVKCIVFRCNVHQSKENQGFYLTISTNINDKRFVLTTNWICSKCFHTLDNFGYQDPPSQLAKNGYREIAQKILDDFKQQDAESARMEKRGRK